MSKQIEKLVNEIVQLGCESNCDAYVNGKCQVSPEYRKNRCLPFIERVITRIGKAYADGELELPGEVVFAHTPDKVTEGGIATFWQDIWRRMKAEGWLDSGLTTLIALRKEEKK